MSASWKQKITPIHTVLVTPKKDVSSLRLAAGLLKRKRKKLESYYEKTRTQ